MYLQGKGDNHRRREGGACQRQPRRAAKPQVQAGSKRPKSDLIPVFICLVHLRSTPFSLDFGVFIFKIGKLDQMANATPGSKELHAVIMHPESGQSDYYNQIITAHVD